MHRHRLLENNACHAGKNGDPDCSPAAFAWTYAASLLGLGAAALGCYTYNIKPGNSVTLLIPMIIVLWCGSFALCLAVRDGLLRSRT